MFKNIYLDISAHRTFGPVALGRNGMYCNVCNRSGYLRSFSAIVIVAVVSVPVSTTSFSFNPSITVSSPSYSQSDIMSRSDNVSTSSPRAKSTVTSAPEFHS